MAHDGPARSYCSTPRVEPATIDSWEHGAQGWTLWVAMGLMLAEAVTSFALILVKQAAPLLHARRGGAGPPPGTQFSLRSLGGGADATATPDGEPGGAGASLTLSDDSSVDDGGGAVFEKATVEVAPPSQLSRLKVAPEAQSRA